MTPKFMLKFASFFILIPATIMSTPTPSTATKKQLNKEAKWSFGLTILYLIGWIISAYYSPDGYGIFGLPLWFEMSCFYLPIAFILAGILTLKGIYQDIDFQEYDVVDRDLTNPVANTLQANDKDQP